jgi:hypothetical protein
MKKHIYDETNGLSYTLHGDYYLPDLVLPEDETPHYGKYGMLRKTYLKEHRNSLYQALLLQGKLIAHLNEIDDTANARMKLLTRQMQENQHVNEGLKSQNQMAWVGAMNNIRSAAEEIIFRELIYV